MWVAFSIFVFINKSLSTPIPTWQSIHIYLLTGSIQHLTDMHTCTCLDSDSRVLKESLVINFVKTSNILMQNGIQKIKIEELFLKEAFNSYN